MMKISQFVGCMFAGALVAGCSMKGPEPAAPAVTSIATNVPGKVSQANVATVSAIVESVDLPNRLVTLRLADGGTRTLTAGDEVRNLAQVRKGDEVSVGYLESVAVQVMKPGEGELGTVEADTLERAALGQKPGGGAAHTVVVTAKIVEIDRAGQTVTLQGKEGKRFTLNVRNPAHFDVIAVNDLVEFTYIEAMAISVDSIRKQ